MYSNAGQTTKLFEGAYPVLRNQLAEVALALDRIGMLAAVEAALDESEALARSGEYDKAEDVILEMTRALMRASGTMERLEKRYAKPKPDLLH